MLTGLILITLYAVLIAQPASAQDGARAGVIIVHGDGSVTQQCVRFDEAEISGYELLKRAGLNIGMEAGSTGATICSIDGEGCNFPQESCFCKCQGSPCVYWSYWRQKDGVWLYQNLGAGNSKVHDGDVDGWHWSEGTVSDAAEPPLVTLDEICTDKATATDSAATAVTTTAAIAVNQNSTTPTSPTTGPGTGSGLWLLAGAAGVALAGGIWYLLRSRRDKAP